MNGQDRGRRWESLKQRLGLKRMGCCGTTRVPQSGPTESGRVEPGMNLAAALAAERSSRAGPTAQAKSLMALIEETDGCDWKKREGDCDCVCCVCMERPRGAAFIPCGHTFCRVCSREIWLNRGMCPICNRPIIEILDIY